MFHPTPHKYSAMVCWPVVRSLHRFCKLDDTPYRRMGMSYQVEEIVVPALAHVVGSGITVECGIMYVPNGW